MFRKPSYKMSLGISLFLIFVMIVLVSIIIFISSQNDSKSGRYVIPTYTQGDVTRIVPPPALAYPIFTDGEISDFVAEAMNNTLTLSFDDYESSTDFSQRNYFTYSGWKKFTSNIKKVGIFDNIFKRKEIIEFYPTRVPFVTYEGTVRGNTDGKVSSQRYYVWRVHVFGKFYMRQLQNKANSDGGYVSSSFFSYRQEYALVDFFLNIQRVPKGKGMSSVKIIDSDKWKILWK